MTREEMRMKRELQKAIKKTFLRPISKRHGYKTTDGMVYCVHDDWLYTIFVTYPENSLRIEIRVKPLIIDEIFWEVFEMKEAASKMPFSFHVNAAFVPWSLSLEKWQVPLASVEQAEPVLEKTFSDIDEKIARYRKQITSLSDFQELERRDEPVNHLNCILCDIAMGSYDHALAETEEELANGHSGRFGSADGRDIYDYAKQYCINKLKTHRPD